MKLKEGGNAFDDVGRMSRDDIEATLRYISPIVGVPFESERNKSGKIIHRGLADSGLGSSAKTNAGVFGKTETVGDIDLAIDQDRISYDELLSKLVERLGPENVGKPMRGLQIIPTKIPVGGDESASKGYVQVDFMVGKPDLLTFTFNSPDPESASEYKGMYRNILLNAILQVMRRQVRDPETQEIIALIGPTLLRNRGVVNQWRHFPSKKNGDGRLTKMKPISRDEFKKLYPKEVGKEKEMILDDPQSIVDFVFPGAGAKPSDFDSFEKLRDLVVQHKPENADEIFNRAIIAMQQQNLDIPENLVVECVERIEKQRVLTEVRKHSLSLIQEAVARPEKFEDFRSKCKMLIDAAYCEDHFKAPKCTADVMPEDGIQHLISKCGMTGQYDQLARRDYDGNYSHACSDLHEFLKELCELMLKDNFFFIVDYYGLKMTPESFVHSLLESDYLHECY